MKYYRTIAMTVGFVGLFATGCATAPKSGADRTQLTNDATAALQQAKQTDASLAQFLQASSGYVVFPHVDKGAALVGGSYGRGIVYDGNELIGYADITQATVGLQAGGQEFREIVVFESQGDLDRFKAGKLTLSANVSAVALKSGAAESAKYTDGVAVFVQPTAGLMVEAAVGGQQFTYQPK
jgi:lipid-binding SYLF domain-containing protein